ncbi:MAG: glycoside hydrolase family 97 catalytic domain-containing protein [Bifidobacteriaceae bacterium]|jgi:hypothetical protein|nr:glycoside hydrolase family 97 catalytic domain-containing protein [Bifidobacteriaceae bacterium]
MTTPELWSLVVPEPGSGPERLTAELTVHNGQVSLAVRRGERTVMEGTVLGVTIDGNALAAGHPRSTPPHQVDQTYTMFTGKATGRRTCTHTEAEAHFRDPASGTEWGVVLRVAPDGVAWRYRIGPAEADPMKPPHTHVMGTELTELTFPEASRAWLLEYKTWYETPRFGADLETAEEGDYGFPVLVNAGGDEYALFSEAAIDGTSSGAHAYLARNDGRVTWKVIAADPATEVATGHLTPWRVVITGPLGSVVESELVDQLAPPASAEDPAPESFVRPGRAAWSWWSSQYSGAYLDAQLRFVDFAHRQGWEHLLVDCGWDETWVPELVAYASLRGVQVHLWSAWTDLATPEDLRKLELWKSWGVAGIKVDFMESESQERYAWYSQIIAKTAALGLMINFHGSVIPRGWARTYPHVMTYEAIRGAEYYAFYGDPLTASHNVIQPFTRNVIGSMDYTPVAFSAKGRETTDAHELALSVVFESGITHFADDPAAYQARPLAARFLSELPPVWDETRFIAGQPDREAAIARRSGDRWFVGCIATGEPRTVRLDLTGLPPAAWVVADAARGLTASQTDLGPDRVLELPLAANGGFVAILAEDSAGLCRFEQPKVFPAVPLEPQVAGLDATGAAQIHTLAEAQVTVPPGWTARPEGDGFWAIQAPGGLPPGSLGVVSAGQPAANGVTRLSHCRLVAPYAAGSYNLSALPFLACSNGFGPIERDQSNGGGDPRDGGPLSVAGQHYELGLGTAASSAVEVHLDAAVESICGLVGVDDETPEGTAMVEVRVDGRTVFSAEVTGGQPPVAFEIKTRGASRAKFVASSQTSQAHVDWLDVRLEARSMTDTGGERVQPTKGR